SRKSSRNSLHVSAPGAVADLLPLALHAVSTSKALASAAPPKRANLRVIPFSPSVRWRGSAIPPVPLHPIIDERQAIRLWCGAKKPLRRSRDGDYSPSPFRRPRAAAGHPVQRTLPARLRRLSLLLGRALHRGDGDD